MKLDNSKTALQISINGTYSAHEVERLLRQLALLRADMAPEVPMTQKELDETAHVLMEDKPGLRIAELRQGGFRLWLRHRGYGWLAYQIDARTAAGAAKFIHGKTSGVEALDLIGHGDGHKH